MCQTLPVLSPNWKSLQTSHSAALKLLSSKLLSPIAEKEPIAEDIVNVLQIDGRGPCHSTPVSASNNLCRLLITYRLPSVYASLQPRTTKSFKIEVCRSSISATRPIPIPDDAYPYPTCAENCYPTRPAPRVYPYP